MEYSEWISKISKNKKKNNMKILNNIILDEPSCQKSLSSMILLTHSLKTTEKYNETIAFLKYSRCNNKEKSAVRFKIMLNNLQFLIDKQLEAGSLYCEYCNKGPLAIYGFDIFNIENSEIVKIISSNGKYRFSNNFNPENGATCDHKQPTSKGGEKYDYSNLAVCCSQCNRAKSDVDYQTWLKYLKQKESF